MSKSELLFVELSGNSLFFSYTGKNFVVILKKKINYSGIQKAAIRKLFYNLNNIFF